MDNINSIYQKWKSLQSHWDDDEFLKSLTPLMRLRYKMLDEKVAKIFEAEFQKVSGVPLLVDVGCGRAEFAAFMRERWKDDPHLQRDPWNYAGIEPSTEQLKQRDISSMGLGFVQATAERVPFPDMVAHGVLIKEVIDHCYDPVTVFREAGRILKPGGVLVVTVTNDKSWYKRLLPWVNRAFKAKQTDHLFFFGPTDLKKLAEVTQFDRVWVETYNYLKLPRILERALSLLGPSINRWLLNIKDATGKILLPGLGGGILLKAYKK
jgi:ubiquinone/menaquinone biosynthesis C-methylase UbiE